MCRRAEHHVAFGKRLYNQSSIRQEVARSCCMGVSGDTGLACFFTLNRFLRIAGGPDEVRMSQLGKLKIEEYDAIPPRGISIPSP